MEIFLINRLIKIIPMNSIFCQLIVHNKLVLGGATGKLACIDTQSTGIIIYTLPAGNGLLTQFFGIELVVNIVR